MNVKFGLSHTVITPGPETRQARLERLCEYNYERRRTEKVDICQFRLVQNWEASQWNKPQQTSMPALEDEWVQGKLTAFQPKIYNNILRLKICDQFAQAHPPQQYFSSNTYNVPWWD